MKNKFKNAVFFCIMAGSAIGNLALAADQPQLAPLYEEMSVALQSKIQQQLIEKTLLQLALPAIEPEIIVSPVNRFAIQKGDCTKQTVNNAS